MKPGRKALAGETLASHVDGRQEQEWCRTRLPDVTCVQGGQGQKLQDTVARETGGDHRHM